MSTHVSKEEFRAMAQAFIESWSAPVVFGAFSGNLMDKGPIETAVAFWDFFRGGEELLALVPEEVEIHLSEEEVCRECLKCLYEALHSAILTALEEWDDEDADDASDLPNL